MKNDTDRGGFTLIEVIVVVLIIVALATMVVPFLADLPERMRSQIVQGDMQALDTVLKVYRLENGSYPTTLAALLSVPASAKGRKERYLDSEPNDPWENPYQYKYPGGRSLKGYDLWSMGPNGSDDGGENDDIANWQTAKE